jgi:hypothetical protein
MLFVVLFRQKWRPMLVTHATSATVLKPMSRWNATLAW